MNRGLKFLDMMKEINDDFATVESWFGYSEPFFSQRNLKVYDPDHYDLIPSKHHIENRLKEKEQQLSNLEGIQKHYEEQHKKIQGEIEELKQQINKKG
jgi:hypothetical protein